jgi:exodeoxyribonuclease VII small subunit
MAMAAETMTFKEAYGVLQEHAETLRNQTEPSIDDLLSIVEESLKAYKVCKERIDAVENALQKALTDVGTETSPRNGAEEGSANPGPVRGAASARATPLTMEQKPARSGFEDMDDDIPF